MVPDQVPVGLDDLVNKLVILLGERVLPELRALLAELGLLVAEEVADVDHFSGVRGVEGSGIVLKILVGCYGGLGGGEIKWVW